MSNKTLVRLIVFMVLINTAWILWGLERAAALFGFSVIILLLQILEKLEAKP